MSKTTLSGVLLLDKSAELSSQQAVARAKYLLQSAAFNSKKAGHTGTLDPMATGLLPICFGFATRFAGMGLNADKSYLATLQLGVQTDTADARGAVIAQCAIPDVAQNALDAIAKNLMGKQWQTPPMYSALKKEGKKLYELARAGETVERAPRLIEIIKLSLTKIDDSAIALAATVSKGTYIRVLGETIAEQLGTLGHLTALRRTQTGGFGVQNAITLDELAALPLVARHNLLLPSDVLLQDLPHLVIDKSEYERLKMGQRLNAHARTAAVFAVASTQATKDQATDCRLYCADNAEKVQDTLAILGSGLGDFVGLGRVERSGRVSPVKMLL